MSTHSYDDPSLDDGPTLGGAGMALLIVLLSFAAVAAAVLLLRGLI